MFSFYEIRKYNGDKKIMIKLRFIFNFFPKMFQPYPHSLSNLHFDPLPQEDLGPCTIWKSFLKKVLADFSIVQIEWDFQGIYLAIVI